jgi:DNA-binding NarL/FixJ family response regulator
VLDHVERKIIEAAKGPHGNDYQKARLEYGMCEEEKSCGMQPSDDGRSRWCRSASPTPREFEIIRLLTEGKANKEIASELAITVRTVDAHRSRLMRKLGMHSLAELIHYAMDNGIAPARGSR